MGAPHSNFYWDLNLGRDWRIKIVLSGVEWRCKEMNVTYAATAPMVRKHCVDVKLQSGVILKAASF